MNAAGEKRKRLGARRLAKWSVAAALLPLGCACYAVYDANRDWDGVRWAPQPGPTIAAASGARRLVVLVHGFQQGVAAVRGLEAWLRTAMPEADVATVDYSLPIFSKQSANSVANSIENLIRHRWEVRVEGRPKYSDVCIVAYSTGTLLARRAYLNARGRHDPRFGKRRSVHEGWADHVTSFVLIAGTNRGWSITPQMSALTRWKTRLALAAAQATGTGGFLRDIRHGSSFVGNLRLQWTEEMLDVNEQSKTPRVVQIYGADDDVISDEEDVDGEIPVDNTASSDIPGVDLLRIQCTGHESILDLEDRKHGAKRRCALTEALGIEAAFPDDDRPQRSKPLILGSDDPPRRDVKDVVVILHGIRDRGEWARGIEESIRRKMQNVEVFSKSFGFVGVLPFLSKHRAEERFLWLFNRFMEIRIRFPEAKISVIAHSYGTYILGHALQLFGAISLKDVVLAGSVLRSDFDWDKCKGGKPPQVTGRVLNIRSSGDWVVGIFPGAFEQVGISDVGAAGLNGFNCECTGKEFGGWIRGGHDAALEPAMHERLAAFLGGGRFDAGDRAIGEIDRDVSLMSKMALVIWTAVLVFVVLLTVYLPWRLGRNFWKSRPVAGRVVCIACAQGLLLTALIFF